MCISCILVLYLQVSQQLIYWFSQLLCTAFISLTRLLNASMSLFKLQSTVSHQMWILLAEVGKNLFLSQIYFLPPATRCHVWYMNVLLSVRGMLTTEGMQIFSIRCRLMWLFSKCFSSPQLIPLELLEV